MARPRKDYTGTNFGMLTAVRCVDQKKRKWEFACACGGKTVATISNVQARRTKSCGCHRSTNRVEHGKRYNYLTAMYLIKTGPDQGKWMWRCESGNFVAAYAHDVQSGRLRAATARIARQLDTGKLLPSSAVAVDPQKPPFERLIVTSQPGYPDMSVATHAQRLGISPVEALKIFLKTGQL